MVDFCRGADLLIHDAQYTPKELANRRGWGHSSYEQAIECARLAKVKKLVLTHHDPDHNDAFLSEVEQRCQELLPNCVLARKYVVCHLGFAAAAEHSSSRIASAHNVPGGVRYPPKKP